MNSTINDIRERHADQSTLNKADLACEVMLRTRCTKVEANYFTNSVLESMTDILAAGKGLEIRGFGVFKLRRCARQTRHCAPGSLRASSRGWSRLPNRMRQESR